MDTSQKKSDFESLRTQISDVTESILDLAVARQKLAIEIGKSKKLTGLPIENLEIESALIGKMEEYARSAGLEEGLARSLAYNLIDFSKISQYKEIFEPQIDSFLKNEKIGSVSIIGAGRMGCWFAKYFKPFTNVTLFDSNSKRAKVNASEIGCKYSNDFDDALSTADLIILAVPMSRIPEEIRVLEQSNKSLRAIEISSIKSQVGSSKISKNLKLYSIHPLFGASANHFAQNTMIEVGRSRDKFIRKLFPHFKYFKMNRQEHDKLMLVLLSLPHALSFVFADIISKSKIRGKVTSPSFENMLSLSKKVFNESPEVYFEIQALNPYRKVLWKDIENSTKSLKRLTEDRKSFRKFFWQKRKSISRK